MLKDIFNDFLKSYDEKLKDKIWTEQSKKFNDFWKTRIRNAAKPGLTDAEIDKYVMIIDRSGKGNTQHSEAIARVMVPQGAWRRLYRSFRSDKKLLRLMDSILSAKNDETRATAIDELYQHNKGNNNYLTGKSGNTINAFLAAFDPFKNLSMVSLKDRYTFIEAMKIPVTEALKESSIGTQIIETNSLILKFFKESGIEYNARTISVFCYSPFMMKEWKLNVLTTSQGETEVTVPEKNDEDNFSKSGSSKKEIKESSKIQAMIANIGAEMGFKIWLPKADRTTVCTDWKPGDGQLIQHLPLNYSNAVMKTIENIDVIWISNRSIVRAFEVEHTTSIYSGLLRMADLVAMLPNLNMKLHIVAPTERKEKVFEEIKRPVFSLLEGGPLSNLCSYLSYENITEISKDPHLKHLNDSVLEDFAESAD